MADPARITNEELEIVVCGPDERAEQADLFNRCFKKRLGTSELRWRYDDGPHGPAISLVARPPGAGELGISGYACSPRRALVRGEPASEAQLGQTGDVMTDPAWRKRGIFSDLDRRCMAEAREACWPVSIGYPNRRSAHIFLKLGWNRVGSLRPWSFFFQGGGPAREVRLREGRLRAALLPLARLGANAKRKALARRAGDQLTAHPLERFPDEVENLSRQVESRYELMVRRDAAYLNWRFVDNPGGLHRCIGIHGSDGFLRGYAVVQVPREGSPAGYLVDVLGQDDAVVAAAIAAALDTLEAAGAVLAEATAIDGSDWERELRAAGFLAPKPDNHLIVITHVHQPDHPLARAAADASRWYFTDGDRDDETMG